MKIVVLAGGISTERDVSLSSGTQIYKALKANGHQAILLDVFLGYEGDCAHIFEKETDWIQEVAPVGETAPDIAQVKASRKDQSGVLFGENVIVICQEAELVFMALHGDCGENGKIQAAFDLFDIKYTGTDSLSSALAMDKTLTKQLFVMNGIKTPKSYLLAGPKDTTKPEFPCVVKISGGGSSVGVYIAKNEEEYKAAVKEAFCYEGKVLVEQYIKGREFTACVIEDKALPVVEIAPLSGFYDYKNKYQAGSTIETCPAQIDEALTKKIQNMAVLAYQVLGISTYARMDFMVDENGECYCLEANTLPGMTPTSLIPQEAAAIGKSFAELCEWIIEISMKKYEK
ncbi:MAG TPA: D-alanine--D-alanine ligase [Lachnospiraceae bacterium]|nr:D-alanine--D-alanine ligase [Lachnospiraceae bacterium]